MLVYAYQVYCYKHILYVCVENIASSALNFDDLFESTEKKDDKNFWDKATQRPFWSCDSKVI